MEAINKRVEEMNKWLNINHLDIINNPIFDKNQKQKELFKLGLTAILQKYKGSKLLDKDFKVEEYVEFQCQAIFTTEKTIYSIPALFILREDVDRIKQAQGNDIKEEVIKIFDAIISTTEKNDLTEIAEILIAAGGLAISVFGAIAALAALPTGALTAAAVVGLVASGLGVLASVAGILYAIFSFIDFERDFFGIIINDTQYDMIVGGDFKNYEHNEKKKEGVYLKHGDLSVIFCDTDEKEKTPTTYIKNNLTVKDGAFIGVFQFVKTPFPNTVGSEGVIRMKARNNSKVIDVFAACPASNDNRMMISCKYSDMELKRSDEAMYNAMIDDKNLVRKDNAKISYSETSDGFEMKSAVNDHRNSPTWGIASVTKR